MFQGYIYGQIFSAKGVKYYILFVDTYHVCTEREGVFNVLLYSSNSRRSLQNL